MPDISIIVPVYKVKNYLHRCIDSILNQTYQNFELILVDDGSPDNCGAICDEYAAKDSRIQVIHKENGGLSSARNAGLDVARGTYIMFCDSDDLVMPDWCERSYCCIIENPTAWIVTDVFRFSSYPIDYMQINDSSPNLLVEKKTYFEIYKMGISAYACNKIYSRELLEKAHLRFDEKCFFAEDVAFNTKYCRMCDYCILIPKKLYLYYQNQNGIMHRYYDNWLELHLPLFSCRLPLIHTDEMEEFCDLWLYHFLTYLNVVFDKRNTMSFFQKMKYNQRMVNTEQFQFCLKHASGKKENPLMLKILQSRNYYLFWFISQLTRLKQKIRRK